MAPHSHQIVEQPHAARLSPFPVRLPQNKGLFEKRRIIPGRQIEGLPIPSFQRPQTGDELQIPVARPGQGGVNLPGVPGHLPGHYRQNVVRRAVRV